MKYKTAELTGALLDAAVAKANGLVYEIHPEKVWGDGYGITIVNQSPACWTGPGYYEPSTDWSHGGPIIERERIDVEYSPAILDWTATHPGCNGVMPKSGHGEMLLTAAMRAFVRSRLGDEVDL